MRIRYGKPIKVKSLLGQLNVPTLLTKASSTNIIVVKGGDGAFRFGEGINTGKGIFNITIDHTYFFYLKVSGLTPTNTNTRRFSIWNKTSGAYLAWVTTTNLDDNQYIGTWKATTSTEIYNCFSFQYDASVSNPSLTAYEMIAIDLTEIGLDNLTSQQFYNKYNKYFPLIATGREITIDDKAGSVLSESISNMFKSSDRTINVGGTGVGGKGWNGSNLSITAFSNQNNYTSVIYSFTDNGFTVQASESDFVNGVALEIPFKVKGNCTYKITYDYEGADGYLEYKQYNNSYVMSNLSVSSGVFTTNYDTEWIVIRFRAPRAGTVGTYSNVKLIRQTPISCKVAGGSSDIYYGYNQIFIPSHYSGQAAGYGTITESFENNIKIYTYTFGSSIYSNAYSNKITNANLMPISGHRYYYRVSVKAPRIGQFYIRGGLSNINVTQINTWTTGEAINGPWSSTASWYVSPSNPSEQGYQEGDSYQAIINCIDLTNWYGAGKEPSTVAEFKEKFTKDYYGYCPTPIKLTRYQIEALPSYGYNQLVNNLAYTANKTDKGVTFTHNEDGSWTVNGTASGGNPYLLTNMSIKINNTHKYLLFGYRSNIVGSSSTFYLSTNYHGNYFHYDYGDGIIFVPSNNTSGELSVAIRVFSGTQINNAVFMPMLIDLTDWYGAGSEPTTIEEFKQTFPNKYYPYSKKRLLNKYMINMLKN